MKLALTQTQNAYTDMPADIKDLGHLKGQLEDIRKANVDHHIELIARAAQEDVRVICLGELFTAPYFALTEEPFWKDMAEDARFGPTVQTLSEAAKTHQIIIIAPIYELDAQSGKRYNTAVVIDEKGNISGTYRKSHIPEGKNEQGPFIETFYYGRSDTPPYFPVFDTSAGKIGITICYDRHFEGVVRTLVQNGAEIIFSPAVTFGEKSQRMWDMEFKVDAARHRVFIGGSNRLGAEKPWNQAYFGESHFAGPDGERLKNISPHPKLIISDVDTARLRTKDPSGWNLTRDTRPEIYK